MQQKELNSTYSNIKQVLETARNNAYRAVNFEMVQAYWHIGRIIVEQEQKGSKRADYGSYLIKELSKKLRVGYGGGFDISNLKHMRDFYLTFQKGDALRRQLTWTHYRLLLRVKNQSARNFYIIESISNRWSTRELERQINSLLYERLCLSKDKNKVKQLALKGQIIEKPEDLIKDPYVLEFLDLEQNKKYLEKDVEQILINKLQKFILELGKGFTFVARQKRITVENDHYYIDLVFYNYILKCFVLIDIKMGKLTHQDIGQMNFYINYFEKQEKQQGDNPTIGMILCTDKNETMVKYALLNKNLFASKYRLYLPTEEELKNEINKEKIKIEENLIIKDETNS